LSNSSKIVKSVCESRKGNIGRNRIKLTLALMAHNPMNLMAIKQVLKMVRLTKIRMEKLLQETKLHAM